MGSFFEDIGVFYLVLPQIVGIGEPEIAQDDQGRIGGAGPGKAGIEVIGDLPGGGVAEDQLAVAGMEEEGDEVMYTDAGGIGPFVDDLEMAKYAGMIGKVEGIFQVDGNGREIGERRGGLCFADGDV